MAEPFVRTNEVPGVTRLFLENEPKKWSATYLTTDPRYHIIYFDEFRYRIPLPYVHYEFLAWDRDGLYYVERLAMSNRELKSDINRVTVPPLPNIYLSGHHCSGSTAAPSPYDSVRIFWEQRFNIDVWEILHSEQSRVLHDALGVPFPGEQLTLDGITEHFDTLLSHWEEADLELITSIDWPKNVSFVVSGHCKLPMSNGRLCRYRKDFCLIHRCGATTVTGRRCHNPRMSCPHHEEPGGIPE